MSVLEARYRVRDRDAFMGVFRDFRPVRLEMGCQGCRVMGDGDDPQNVVVMFDFPSAEAARAFAADPRRLAALEQAGVERREDLVLEELHAAGP
jgi:hypothetical protein